MDSKEKNKTLCLSPNDSTASGLDAERAENVLNLLTGRYRSGHAEFYKSTWRIVTLESDKDDYGKPR